MIIENDSKKIDQKSTESGTPRRAIIVVGMYRSGGSALAGTLHHLGVAAPKMRMKLQTENSSEGWESPIITRLNDTILGRFDRTVFDPRPIPNIENTKYDQSLIQDEIMNAIDQEYSGSGLFYVKDSRISQILPFWISALERMNVEPTVITAVRSPLAVAISLARRKEISFDQALLLWMSYSLSAERASRHVRRSVIHYHSLLEDWRTTMQVTLGKIACDQLLPSSKNIENLENFLKTFDRDPSSPLFGCMQNESIPDIVKKIYARLCMSPESGCFDPAEWEDAQRHMNTVLSFIPSGRPSTNAITNCATATKQLEKKPTQYRRRLIIHYHLFKNAGTSLDRILKSNFPGGWIEREGHNTGWPSENVADFLASARGVDVLSSHTALLPVPKVDGIRIFPIIFLRHPLDRIRSIYDFERVQKASTEGACFAKQSSFREYVEWRLSRREDYAIRNFQAYRLSLASFQGSSLEERAFEGLKILPFVGVVEEFDKSIERLQKWLQPVFPHIKFNSVKVNVTQENATTLPERVENMAATLGDDVFRTLEQENAIDLKLYEEACKNIKSNKNDNAKSHYTDPG